MRGCYKVWFSTDPATGLPILVPEQVNAGDSPQWIGFPAKRYLCDQFNYGSVIAGYQVTQMLSCLLLVVWNDNQGFNNAIYPTGWGHYENVLVNKATLARLESQLAKLRAA
jgi:hypothetical protein